MRRITSDGDLEVACPLCHAPAGRPCVSTGRHGPMPGVIHRERRRAAEEESHWSFSYVAEYHLHDAAHCKHWYDNVWCYRHTQSPVATDG